MLYTAYPFLHNTGMIHTTELIVRPYECDSYNHVNNAVYQNYLEYARMDFLHAAGFNYKKIVAEGYYLYVTHIDIFYKSSAVLDDKLLIITRPTKLKHVMGMFHQTIKKEDGTICVEADVTWAIVNHEGRPSKMPDGYMVEGLVPSAE